MLRNLRAFAGSAVGAIFILLLALPFVANTGQGPQSTGTQGSSVVSTEGERFYDIEVQRAANLTFLQSADLVDGNPRTVDEHVPWKDGSVLRTQLCLSSRSSQ